MKTLSAASAGLLAVCLLFVGPTFGEEAGRGFVWHDLVGFSVKGRGWDEPDRPFTRLPAEAEGVVRPSVWRLSHDTAGLYVEFTTDAPTLSLQWEVTREALALWHMPSVSVSGFDLYVRSGEGWDWLAVARPRAFPASESVLVENLPAESRHYRLYFPLYNGVAATRIGVSRGHAIDEIVDERRPPMVVFYGTSIVQGASVVARKSLYEHRVIVP
jgi:hypothetical protein